MRILANAVLWTLLTATAVSAQNALGRYSTPGVPPQQALDRLNLKLAWYTYLPIDGRRDGVSGMQLLGSQLVFELRSGALVSLNAATGALQWQTQVGVPYIPPVGVGSNANTLFVAKGVRLTALDRTTGAYQWEVALSAAPAAAAVADEERLFVPAGTDKLLAFVLPGPQEAAPPPVPSERRHATLPGPASGAS